MSVVFTHGCENRIKPRKYVRRIKLSTMYENFFILLAGTGVKKISSIACWLSPIKIHFFLITRNVATEAHL